MPLFPPVGRICGAARMRFYRSSEPPGRGGYHHRPAIFADACESTEGGVRAGCWLWGFQKANRNSRRGINKIRFDLSHWKKSRVTMIP